VYREDPLALDRELRRVRREADEVGEGGMGFQFQLLEISLEATRFRIAALEAHVARLLREWPTSVRTFQRPMIESFEIYTHAFAGRGIEARRANAKFVKGESGYRPFRTMYAGVCAAYAAFVEVQALCAGDPAASPAHARRYAAIAVVSPPFATGRGVRALAYLADHQGDPEGAIARLRESIVHAETHGQICEIAVGKYQLGRRLGGDAGAALASDARAAARRYGLDERLLDEHLLFK
jgi:hypothetical protein